MPSKWRRELGLARATVAIAWRVLGDVALAPALGDEAAAGRSAARRRAKSRSWSSDPVEGRGREDRVDRLVELQLGEVGDQVGGRSPQPLPRLLDHRLRAVDGDAPGPRAGARSAAPVTRPEPQPASSTVSSPLSSSRSSTSSPTRLRGRRPRRRSRRPSRGAGVHRAAMRRSERRRDRAARGAAGALEASIAAAFSSVMPMSSRPFSRRCLTSGSTSNSKTPAAQVTVSSSTSIRASPASATARQCSSSRIAGSSPILVQLE